MAVLNSAVLCILFSLACVVLSLPNTRTRRGQDFVSSMSYDDAAEGPLTQAHHDLMKNDLTRQKRSAASEFIFDYTQEERAEILQRHNLLRSGVDPTATNMQHMIWDTDLEIQAQIWTSYCTFEHGGHDGFGDYATVGQNLFSKHGANVNNKAGVNGPMTAWGEDEQANYNYDAMSCSGGSCGHFTQMVWDTTFAVGCGRNYCPDGVYDSGSDSFRWIVACHYGPAGNAQGASPYTSGDSCSDCPLQYEGTCADNLCMETVTCLGLECQNGGLLNETNCLCDGCTEEYPGAFCQGLPDEDAILAVAPNGLGMVNGVGTYPDFVTWGEGSSDEESSDDPTTVEPTIDGGEDNNDDENDQGSSEMVEVRGVVTLAGDYASQVAGPGLAAFRDQMLPQIATSLQVQEEQITDFTATAGSIIIEFIVTAPSDTGAAGTDYTEVMAALEDLADSALTGIDGEALTVQTVTHVVILDADTPVTDPDEDSGSCTLIVNLVVFTMSAILTPRLVSP